MPISKSAKKALRVSQNKRAQNLTKEIALDKALKKVSTETVSDVISLIDKAAKTNLMHKNKAARMKSTLTKKFGTPKKADKPAEKKTESKPKVAKVKKETK